MLFLSTAEESNNYRYQFMVMSFKGTQYVQIILTLKLDTNAGNQPPVKAINGLCKKTDISEEMNYKYVIQNNNFPCGKK
jgi:Cys-tRNA synthase (O-phospho-L-seryl-tRNA:Cys-tRNA synthase)